jgi:plasmid stabilization system protein ParE
MPLIKVSFHPEAVEEVETARRWYAERSPLAARAFLAELNLAVERVRETPERWPRYTKGVRRYVLPRFPFTMIYRKKGEVVEVVAVAHHRRKPGYWKSR